VSASTFGPDFHQQVSRQSKLLQQLEASSVQSPLLTCGVAGLCRDTTGATSFFRLAGRTVPVRAAT
jgi:hypothetical protein